MKTVVVLGVLAVVVGGCGSGSPITAGDRLSPRTVAVAAQNVIEVRNSAGVIDLTAPPFRKSMRSVLDAFADYAREADKTAALIAQRVDLAAADRLRNETADFYHQLLPPPLRAAARGDVIDWTRVDFHEDKNIARVYIDGQRSPFHRDFVFVRTGNAWYIEPLNTPEGFAVDARRLASNYRSAIKTLRKVQAEIRGGHLTAQDIDARLWPILNP